MFARVDIGVTEVPTKTAKKYEIKKLSLRFFFQKWACASRFQWGELFHLNCLAARKN